MKSPAIIPLSFVVAAAGCGGAEPAPSGGPTPPFSALEVTAMSLRHDLARPLEAGHALPLHFSVRSASPSDENHLTAEVQALVTLVEVSTAAPETRRRCEVGSDLLQVPLDGRPVSYDEPLVIPLECLPTGMTAADYNIEVQLVVGSRTDPDTAPEGFRSTFLFDAANVASDERPERTCRLNGSETSRCGVALRLNPSGGFHLVAGIRPMSSVGVIWPRTV